MRLIRPLVIVILVACSTSFVWAQDSLVIVKNLRYEVKQHKGGKIQPLLGRQQSTRNFVSLSRSLLKKGNLYADLPAHTFLIYNDQVLFETQKSGWTRIPIMEFMEQDNLGSSVKLMFYCNTAFALKGILLGRPIEEQAKRPELITRGNGYKEQNVIVFTLLTILAAIAFLRRQQLTFLQAYFDVRKLWSLASLDDHIIFNAFSPRSLFVSFVAAAGLGLTLVVNDYRIVLLDKVFGEMNEPLVKLCVYVLFVYALFIVKFFFLKVLSAIMNLKGAYRLHFFEFVRFWVLIGVTYMFMSILIKIISGSGGEILLNVFTLFILAMWLFRLSVGLRRQVKFKNVYFFSYLCASEILPVVLIAKQIEHIV